MKIIDTFGGPIIGVERDHLVNWRGIEGHGFSGAASLRMNDYNWLCEAAHPGGQEVSCSRLLKGKDGQIIIVLSMFEAGIIQCSSGSFVIFQVQFADEDWSISELRTRLSHYLQVCRFDQASFQTRGGEFVFFDSARSGSDIEDSCLIAVLKEGEYELKSTYVEDAKAGFYLHSIAPKSTGAKWIAPT